MTGFHYGVITNITTESTPFYVYMSWSMDWSWGVVSKLV